MKKKNKLVNKVKYLIRKANLPRYLHRFGPKKFLFWKLLLGLLIKETFRLSYRRAMKFLDEFYNLKMHWTTFQKLRKRLPLNIWQNLLSSTIDAPISIGAIDGTSLQRNNPSEHYLKRIDRETKTSIPIYLNAMIDVVQRKFIAVRHHANKSGEVADVSYLVDQCKQEIDMLLMDKAYDSEKLHKYLRELGIFSVIPVKKNWEKSNLENN